MCTASPVCPHTIAVVATLASYLAPLGLYPSRRLLMALGGPLFAVAIVAAFASWVAVAIGMMLVGVALASGPSTAPKDPGYLDRAPSAAVVAATVAAPTLEGRVILRPTEVADLQTALATVTASLDRAIASRHRARAERYRARIVLIQSQLDAALSH
jgi:hypothetical protein